MIVVPFHPIHLERIELQKAQSNFVSIINDPRYAQAVYENSDSYSLIEENTFKVICSGGLINTGGGRALGWALLSKDAGPYMKRLTKEVKKLFVGYNRIEIAVYEKFRAAHRWAEMLGFTCESRMPKYFDGETYFLYSRLF